MDAALLTTVEQLSDDATGQRREAAAWPAGSGLPSPQSSQPPLSVVPEGVRQQHTDAADRKESNPPAAIAMDHAPSDPPVPAWPAQPQTDFLDWSSTLASQHLSDEAPGVFTITDRKVRGGDDPFDIPIYTLCRRWVRNDPYNNEAPVTDLPGSSEPLGLPEPLPLQAGQDSPHPIEGPLPTTSNGDPDTEYLLEHHINHWLKVKEHHVKKIKRKQARYRERLRILLQRPHSDSANDLPSQPEGTAPNSSNA